MYGDVNSTVAAALVASKLGIRVAHVEAGLRSYDRTMPEEINRIVTDRLANLLLTPSRDASETLKREGEPDEEIAFVGNVMIDTLHARVASRASEWVSVAIGRWRWRDRGHAPPSLERRRPCSPWAHRRGRCVSLRRPGPVVFPAHPRTRQRLAARGDRPRRSPGARSDRLFRDARSRAVGVRRRHGLRGTAGGNDGVRHSVFHGA